MSDHLEFPRPIVFDDDYWLCRCEGFRVYTSGRRVGVITELRFRSRLDRPDELVVRGGLLGNRVVVVAVDEVADVLPRQERIMLRAAEDRREHARLARIRGYLEGTLGSR